MEDKLKSENIKGEKKNLGIISHKETFERAKEKSKNLFQGEMMKCFICKKEEKSNPEIETNWNCISDQETGQKVYLCPNCQTPENTQKVIEFLLQIPNRLVMFKPEKTNPEELENIKKGWEKFRERKKE